MNVGIISDGFVCKIDDGQQPAASGIGCPHCANIKSQRVVRKITRKTF